MDFPQIANTAAAVTGVYGTISIIAAYYLKSQADTSLGETLGSWGLGEQQTVAILRELRGSPEAQVKALKHMLDHMEKLHGKVDPQKFVDDMMRMRRRRRPWKIQAVVFLAFALLAVLAAQVTKSSAGSISPTHSESQAPAFQTETNNPPAFRPGDDFMAANWATARLNIDWVFGDQGAHQNYMSHIGQGKYEALLTAQSHNKGAYQSISEYGEARTMRYLEHIGQ